MTINVRSNPVVIDYNMKLNNEWIEIRRNAIQKIEDFLTSGTNEIKFSKKEYMQYYTSIYNLCTTPIETFQAELYKRYTEEFADFIKREVLPSLEQLSGETLLKELDIRWRKHQVFVRWMQRFF